MRSGITRRWLRGNLLITVLVVLLAEAMFLYSYTRSYYGSVQQIMYRRFSSVTGQLKMYTGDTAPVWRCGAWWSSLPIRINTSSCCWTVTAASLPPPAVRTRRASSAVRTLNRRSTARTVWAWRCTAPSLAR